MAILKFAISAHFRITTQNQWISGLPNPKILLPEFIWGRTPEHKIVFTGDTHG
jgi:hypothetical protein